MNRFSMRTGASMKLVIITGWLLWACGWSNSMWGQSAEVMPPPNVESNDSERLSAENNNNRPSRGRRSTNSLGRQSAELKRVLAPVAQHLEHVVVNVVDGNERVGLGLMVDQRGFLVTKASLWHGQARIQLPTGKHVTANLVAKDGDRDLALLQVEYHPEIAFAWADQSTPQPGSFVVNVGLEAEIINLGVLSARPREFRIQSPRGGFLGISTAALTEPLGLEVTQVVADSAALQAGLRTGDKITHISGRELRAPEQLSQFVSSLRPGDEVELRVVRDSGETVIRAKLGKRTADTSNFDRWGGGPFTSQQRFGFGSVLTHDAPLNPDDCGGPVVNSRGEIIGLNISRALRISTYAIPADQVKSFLQQNLPAK